LFTPFTQADASTTRKFGGTGLGLSISRRLAQMLEGDIVVASVPGFGSRFSLLLDTGPLEGVPMLDYPRDLTGEPAPNKARMEMIQLPDGCRILLVEDGLDNQRLISLILRKAGAEVTVVENGELGMQAALAASEQGLPFDVVLMDMQMPVLDGYAATTRLRALGYAQPIIALTAHAMNGDRQKCLAAGCDDYAQKPVERNKLLQQISKLIQTCDAEVAIGQS
jgi:Amt family ammonium transporter